MFLKSLENFLENKYYVCVPVPPYNSKHSSHDFSILTTLKPSGLWNYNHEKKLRVSARPQLGCNYDVKSQWQNNWNAWLRGLSYDHIKMLSLGIHCPDDYFVLLEFRLCCLQSLYIYTDYKQYFHQFTDRLQPTIYF